jgi:DnaK suppressor protein
MSFANNRLSDSEPAGYSRVPETWSPPQQQEVPASAGTHLTDVELEELRERLEHYRAKLLSDMSRLQNELAWLGDAGFKRKDAGSQTEAKSLSTQMLLRRAVGDKLFRLHEIDSALMRMNQNTYGFCVETRQPIPMARLREIPWASHI